MSGTWISPRLRIEVERRAAGLCEYCRVPNGATMWPHEADHIIAEQHGGKTALENLALSCWHCNRYKGANVASVDRQSGQVVTLYNPRTYRWNEHFTVQGASIVPLTPSARATAELLRFNSAERLLVRQALIKAGRWAT